MVRTHHALSILLRKIPKNSPLYLVFTLSRTRKTRIAARGGKT